MNNSNPFDNKNVGTYTIRTLGESLRERREQLGITSRQLAKNIGIPPVILSEIERCSRPIPLSFISGIDYVTRLAEALSLTDSQKENLNIMAEVSRFDMLNSISNYCIKNTGAIRFLIQAMESNLSNDCWESLYKEIFESKIDQN